MSQWWTFTLIVIMHVQSCLTAVATLPLVSSETKVDAHVQNSSQAEISSTFSTNWPDDVQLGCRELRAKRFISDGFCHSLKPIKEAVCAGHCMPIKEQNLPWWAEFTKYWAKPKFKEWRCVEGVTKLRKVQLQCANGEIRKYKIKIVKSCRCKSYEREPNETDSPHKKRKRGKRQNSEKDKEKRKRERQERRKARREKRKLEKKRNRNKKENLENLENSSQELRKHRHHHEHRDDKKRHEDPTKLDSGVSDSEHRYTQTISNNESPSV